MASRFPTSAGSSTPPPHPLGLEFHPLPDVEPTASPDCPLQPAALVGAWRSFAPLVSLAEIAIRVRSPATGTGSTSSPPSAATVSRLIRKTTPPVVHAILLWASPPGVALAAPTGLLPPPLPAVSPVVRPVSSPTPVPPPPAIPGPVIDLTAQDDSASGDATVVVDAAVGTGQQEDPSLDDPVEDGDEIPIAPVGQALVDELLDRTCKLFALSRDDLAKPGFKFVLPGMKVGLELYQLWAIVWIISSKPHRNIATAMLADEMGLGKTATALGVAALHYTHMTRRQHVLEHPEQHLRRREQDEHAECPLGSYTSGVQCPCLPNGWSRRVAADLSCGPTVVVATGAILDGWAAQFAKFIDPNAPAPLQLVYGPPLPHISSACPALRCSPSPKTSRVSSTTCGSRARAGRPLSPLPLCAASASSTPSTASTSRSSSPWAPTRGTWRSARFTDAFHACLAAFLSCFAVRRTVGEPFAGHKIGPVGRPLRYEALDCHPPADTAQATSALTAEAKAQVRDFFARRVEAWQKEDPGKRGLRPTMHDVIGSMARGLPVSSMFRLLAVCATFPAVARLASTPAFQGWAFTGDDVRDVFTRGTVAEAEAKSPLWQYAPALCAGSTKLVRLRSLVQAILDDKEETWDEPGSGPPVAAPKKMMVLSSSPFPAPLVFVHLAQHFPDLAMCIVTSGMNSNHRQSAYQSFETVSVSELRDQQTSPRPGDPRILVSSLRITVEGLNLARANYMVVMDPAWSESMHRQAFARVQRTGQPFTPRMYMLLDPTNPSETTIRHRQLRRDTLAAGAWEITD